MSAYNVDIGGTHVDRTHQGDYHIYQYNPLTVNVGDTIEVIYSPRAWVLNDSIHRGWCKVTFEVRRGWERNHKTGKMEEFKARIVIEQRLLTASEIGWCERLIKQVEARA